MNEKLINENLTVYMKDVDMLRNIIRYNTAPKNNQETVAEHSFYVAAYVLKLHEFYEFDLEKALSLSLLHDFSEVYISDVPHPVKANNKALEDALESAEYEINKEKLSETVANWLVEFNNRTTAEGTICALADILSVVSYSKNEINLGNKTYMAEVYKKTVKRIREIVKLSAKYLREGYTESDILNSINDFKEI